MLFLSLWEIAIRIEPPVTANPAAIVASAAEAVTPTPARTAAPVPPVRITTAAMTPIMTSAVPKAKKDSQSSPFGSILLTGLFPQ